MKSGVIFAIVLAVCAAGGGYWLGQHHAPHAAVQAPAALPGVPVPRPSVPNAASETIRTGKLSLAEIEAGMLNLKPEDSSFQSQRDMYRLLSDVDATEIPQLMAFIDSKAPKPSRWGLQNQVIQMWA